MIKNAQDLWSVEEGPIDEPFDPVTIPELKRTIARELPDEPIGLRSLLEERDEILARSWRRSQRTGARRATLPLRRGARTLRAA